jgi:hypothetical protein
MPLGYGLGRSCEEKRYKNPTLTSVWPQGVCRGADWKSLQRFDPCVDQPESRASVPFALQSAIADTIKLARDLSVVKGLIGVTVEESQDCSASLAEQPRHGPPLHKLRPPRLLLSSRPDSVVTN